MREAASTTTGGSAKAGARAAAARALACAAALLLAGCSSSSSSPSAPAPSEGVPSEDVAGAGDAAFALGGAITMDDYDWFATPNRRGIIDVALPSGEKRRVLDGAYPWRHPSGKIVFAQTCGDRVNRIAIAEGGRVTPVTGCSDRVENPGFSDTFFEFSRLSPDESLVAVEAGYFLDGANRYSVLVYDLAGRLLANHPNAIAPAWLPDGRLLFARDGIHATDATLQGSTRIDDGSLGGTIGNFDVDPSGTLIAAEHNQQIWLLELATGAAREFKSASKRLRYPTFSPDGSTLAYLAVADGNRYDEAIYFTEIATGADRGIEYPAVGSSNVPNGPLSWTR